MSRFRPANGSPRRGRVVSERFILARQSLHLALGEAAAVAEKGKRVALEWPRSEKAKLNKRETSQGVNSSREDLQRLAGLFALRAGDDTLCGPRGWSDRPKGIPVLLLAAIA